MKGSYEKRGERSWRLTVEKGVFPDGTRDRVRKTIQIDDESLLKTKKRLKDFLISQVEAFKAEVLAGEYIKPEQFIFSDFVNKKYSIHLNKLSPNTISLYNGHIKNHISPFIGNKMMDNIKTLHCIDILNRISHLSASLQICVYTILKSIFSKAQQWQVIKINPMSGVDRPKGETKSKKYYTTAQVREVLQLLQKEPENWRLFFTSAMIGGFRRGELLALEWNDVDFENKVLRISKSVANKQIIKSTKTGKSRLVAMPKWFMDDLEKYKLNWIKDKNDNLDLWVNKISDLVFHNGIGDTYYKTVPSQRWREFTTENEINHIRLHDLRHTAATLLLEDGVDLKVIQERHGHSNFETTANIYAHVTDNLVAKSINSLEKFRPQSVPN